MPNKSEISFLRAAVGLLSAAKKSSSCVSCSGVTLERLRFSRDSPDFAGADAEELARVRCTPDEGSRPDEVSATGDSREGSVEAERGAESAGVRGDIEALGEGEEDSTSNAMSSSEPGLGFAPILRGTTPIRSRREILSSGINRSLAV